MGIFDFLGSIAKPVFAAFKINAEERKLKIEGRLLIQEAKINLEVATLQAKSKSQEKNEDNDMSYDMQVLKNQDRSYMDEIVIFSVIGLVLCHFIPSMQVYMEKGWHAMGYNSPAWWFEFAIVGILVNRLGLMRVLRLFVSVIRPGIGMKSPVKSS